jgi:hypothetical protein
MPRRMIIVAGLLLLCGFAGAYFWRSSSKKSLIDPLAAFVFAQKSPNQWRVPPAIKDAIILASLKEKANQPIRFVGRLVDQHDNPIAGGTVQFGVTHGMAPEETSSIGFVSSDANGVFEISGYRGSRLGMIPKKDGYLIATTNLWPIFSALRPSEQYKPDPAGPTIIRMWK